MITFTTSNKELAAYERAIILNLMRDGLELRAAASEMDSDEVDIYFIGDKTICVEE